MRWPDRKYLIIAAFAVVVVTNVVILAGAAWNRSTEVSRLTLTQRELTLSSDWRASTENSGVSVSIQWRALGDFHADAGINAAYAVRWGLAEWLDRAKLARLGFDVGYPADREGALEHYQRMSSKEVILVLELDGEAYRTFLERLRLRRDVLASALGKSPDDGRLQRSLEVRKQRLEEAELDESRLFVIDAGLDLAAMMATYDGRPNVAFVRGLVSPQVIGKSTKNDTERVGGRIERLSIPAISVARNHHPAISVGDRHPTYAFTVAWGRRLEPWIVGTAAVPGSE